MGLVTGDSASRVELPRYDSNGEDADWQRLERTASPESGDSPAGGMSEKTAEEYEREYEAQRREWAERGKEWEGHRPPGGPGAFI